MGRSGPRTLSFPKSARLLKRSQFLHVKEQGRGFADGPLAASWRARPADPSAAARGGLPPSLARVGLAVSSKVGPSVVRNRVKRLLREAVRQELAGLPPVDLVLVARTSAVRAGVGDFRAWLQRAARRMRSVTGSGR